MPPQAVGPKKSRVSGSKVVPAIPHALASKAKIRDVATAPTAASTASSKTNGVHPVQEVEVSASPTTPSAAQNDGPEHQQQSGANGDAHTSASTSEQSVASTSQSTPPVSVPQTAHQDERNGTKGVSGDDEASSFKQIKSPSAPAEASTDVLPPPFYPASQQSIPSPSPPTSANPERMAAMAAMHHRHNTSLVFGGHRDSASPSPGPAMMRGAPFAAPPPGPPFPNHNPSSPAFVPNGHAHHVSEPFARNMYPPPFIHGSENGGFGREHYPAPFAHGRPFAPGGRGPPVRREYMPSPGLPPPRPTPGPSNSAGPGMMQLVEPSAAEALELARYLRSQFGNREYADHVVVISHSSHKLSPGTFALHGIMLARSPKLASLMSMNHSGPMSIPKTLHVVISDRFVDLDEVVTRGLLHLYGEPLLDLGSIPGLLAVSGFPPNPYLQLRAALAYAALGHFLQMDAVVVRGLDLASTLLRWQNIGLALAFALDGGLGASWSEGADEPTSVASVDESGLPACAPVYGVYSDRMLHAVTSFIIANFPADFDFAAGVPQLPEAPRLPVAAEPRHARSGSRLSQIRFGEMTVEERGPEYSILSGVLVSLPFAVLKHVLEHASLVARLGAARVAEVMSATVEEREQRRLRVAAQSSASSAAPESAMDERLWNSVRWTELVAAVPMAGPESCGLQLRRRCTTTAVETKTGHEAASHDQGGDRTPDTFA